MPKININRSTDITAPVDKTFGVIRDFKQWPSWSPWLIQDPDTKLTYSDDGHSYSWESPRIGSGNMRIVSKKDNEQLDFLLTFIKPWKSTSAVQFKTEATENGTRVSWNMDGSLPFFMFFMKKMMETFVGADYERGLLMLKDYVEQGNVPSKLNFKGEEIYPGCHYIGIKTDCSKEDLGPKMSVDFGRLWDFMSDKMELVAGDPFSVYHKYDMIKGQISYTSGIPLSLIPEDLPEGVISGQLNELKVYTLEHIGPYKHIGNAWSTLYGMGRNKEIIMDKKGIGFETYGNSPREVQENELITRVHYPLK